MILDKETLEKIRKYIAQTGIKDSEFSEQKTIKGGEFITLVDTNGRNTKISTRTLLSFLIAAKDGTESLDGGVQVVETVDQLYTLGAETFGNLVYVIETDSYYSFSVSGDWQQILKLYIGPTEPSDPTVLWVDTSEDDPSLESEDDDEILNIKAALRALQRRMDNLDKIITVGVVAGNVGDSYRQDLIDSADPLKPDNAEGDDDEPEEDGEEEEGEKPDTTDAEPTVNCVCAKRDTSVNFARNKQDLVDGEMLFYTDKKKFAIYYNGGFYTIQSGGSGGGSGQGISLDDLYDAELDYLVFSNGQGIFKAKVNDKGLWTVSPFSKEVTPVGSPLSSWGTYISYLLCINEVFCGGEGSEECACSHNFVELANGSDQDINLNGIYLLYTDGTPTSGIGYQWKVLPLEGIIKAGSTFVVRGARCNTDKASFIKVDSYDIEWMDGSAPIKFKQGPSSFYLCAGTGFQDLLNSNSLSNPWVSNSVKNGYIDSCGFGQGSVGEGSATFTVAEDWNKLLFVRWFMLDPSKQANKAYASRKTTDLWTFINLEKQTMRQGNSTQYYYPDFIKQLYQPQASYKGKDFFSIKTHFNPLKPNMINITFGMQATDGGSDKRASRCFNWVSVGYYDEYLEYKKSSDSEWTKVYSITPNNRDNSETINTFIHYYQRLRWCASDGTWVTSHKCIINGLTAGEYEYRVGRDGDSSYLSDVHTFKVHADSEVTSFSYVQVTDQQGFNWAEYIAWKKTADAINDYEEDFNFTVNTGDATQSGNRASEWLDYYEGRKALRSKEEMFTIGNNDLCGHESTKLTDGNDASSKYNHINILRYYTFELDPRNTHEFSWNGETYPIYSLYSFNYGAFHFVSLNSEIAKATSKMYKDWQDETYAGDDTFANAANAQIEAWFKKDLQLWKNTEEEPTDCAKAIVYCHEMPFTIVTWDFMGGSGARAGSHLNTLNANGNYRYSRLFKKYGIRLVMGGHKHTYCITKPIYDAPDNYITGSNTVRAGADLMGEVTNALSRKPVIQVTRQADIQTNDYARYELVNSINAPTYVMSQASGYKLVSNKEQPSGDAYIIPWLLSYFKAKTNASSPTENVGQHYPMYVRYDVSNNKIVVSATQVHNIWDVNIDRNTKKYDMNNQLTQVTPQKMTLSQTSDADKAAYGISNIESYTINL